MRGIKGALLLVLSGVVGLGAVSMIGQPQRAQAEVTTPANVIVIAREDVPMGQVLNKSMIDTIEWPAAIQPKGAFQTVDELDGRVVNTMLSRGEPLLANKLLPKAGEFVGATDGVRRANPIEAPAALGGTNTANNQKSVEVIRGVQRTNKAL